MVFSRLLATVSGLPVFLLGIPHALAQDSVKLLEPIGDTTEITLDGSTLGAFGTYVNLLYPWVLGMAAAIAVLMGMWGGIEIMQAGADQGKYDGGKNRLLMSLGGLLLTLLASTLLRAINPSFFK